MKKSEKVKKVKITANQNPSTAIVPLYSSQPILSCFSCFFYLKCLFRPILSLSFSETRKSQHREMVRHEEWRCKDSSLHPWPFSSSSCLKLTRARFHCTHLIHLFVFHVCVFHNFCPRSVINDSSSNESTPASAYACFCRERAVQFRSALCSASTHACDTMKSRHSLATDGTAEDGGSRTSNRRFFQTVAMDNEAVDEGRGRWEESGEER